MRYVMMLALLASAVVTAGCGSVGSSAQAAVARYQFHAAATADGNVWFNSRVVAIDGTATGMVELRDEHDGSVIWSLPLADLTGRRAYELVITDDGPEVIPVTWERATALLGAYTWVP